MKKLLYIVGPTAIGKTNADSLVSLVWDFDQEEKLDKMIGLCSIHK